MKKFNVSFIILLVASIFMIGAFVFAKTTLSYPEWYKKKFGVLPDGGVAEWRYDPIYSEYLNEIGETGYNNNVDGTTRKETKGHDWDERYYPTIEDMWWSGNTARWDVEGYASKYQVALFRDGSRVVTKTTTSRSHSFSSEMSRGTNIYFFRVRAYNKDTGWWSDWQESDEKYVSHGSGGIDPTPVGPIVPGPGPGVTPTVKPVNPGAVAGTWQQMNGKWYYLLDNGAYASNMWCKVGDKWYYFLADATMATGWINVGGKTYFLNPDGTMVTGTVVFDGITHFFGEDGAMVY